MGLRSIAQADLAFTLEGDDGWPISITDPAGTIVPDPSDPDAEPLIGQSNDIAEIIDPDTGQVVSGRLASVALRISTLESYFSSLPRGIASSAGKPWVVKFTDVNGDAGTFAVLRSNPDRMLGMITLILETYEES